MPHIIKPSSSRSAVCERVWDIPRIANLVTASLLALAALVSLSGCAERSAVEVNSRETRLTRGSGLKTRPLVSPDGRTVAYTLVNSLQGRDFRTYLVPIDGGDPRPLNSDLSSMALAWSGDGKGLFTYHVDEELNLTVQRLDREGKVQENYGSMDLARVADVSANGDNLLLCTFQGDNFDIAQRRLTGNTTPTVLEETPGWEIGGVFGPGADEVTVVRQEVYGSPVTEIAVWSPRTGASAPLPLPEGKNTDPAWSPNGAYLAFASDRSGTSDIWVLEAASARAVQITSGAKEDSSPSWSPDGEWLAFSRRTLQSHIYLGDPLTFDRWQVTEGEGQDRYPVLSPDGRSVVFLRRGLSSDDGAVPPKICIVSTETGDEVEPDLGRLTLNTGAYRSCWSPDSEQIAFSASDPSGNVDIYRMRRDGTQLTRVTIAPGLDILPAWSPDGTKLAYTRPAGGETQVWGIPAYGGTPRQLSFNEGINQVPLWGPDSDRIAFVSAQSGDVMELWLTSYENPLASQRVPLREKTAWPMAWSKDGKELLVWRQSEDIPKLWAMDLETHDMVLLGVEGKGTEEDPLPAESFIKFTDAGKKYVDRIFPAGRTVFADGEDVADIYLVHVAGTLKSKLQAAENLVR